MIQTIWMTARGMRSIPSDEQMRLEARERINELIAVMLDPDAPPWLVEAAELEIRGLWRLAGIHIEGDPEVQ